MPFCLQTTKIMLCKKDAKDLFSKSCIYIQNDRQTSALVFVQTYRVKFEGIT